MEVKIEDSLLVFIGSLILTYFYSTLNYLQIEPAQFFSLCLIFMISSFITLLKCITLKLSILQFFILEIISKTALICVPLVIAVGAMQIKALQYFLDYIFSVLILGEIFNIILNIQSIRLRKIINEVDFYNLFILKFRTWIYHTLKLDSLNQNGKNHFDEFLEKHHSKEAHPKNTSFREPPLKDTFGDFPNIPQENPPKPPKEEQCKETKP